MFSIKLAGAFFVLLAGVGIGRLLGQDLENNCMALEDAILLLNRMETNLITQHLPLPEMMDELAKSAPFQLFCFTVKSNDSFYQDVAGIERLPQDYIKECGAKRYLNDRQFGLLCQAMSITAGREDTLVSQGYFRKLLENELEQSREHEKKDKKLRMQISVIGAVLLVLILL